MKVLICNPFIFTKPHDHFPQHWEVIQCSPDMFTSLMDKSIDALIVKGIEVRRDTLINCPSLKVISNHGAGLDNIDVDYCMGKAIEVIGVPDTVTEATAELTLGLLIGCTRRMYEGHRLIKNKKKWDVDRLIGYGLYGKTIGIIGMGKIGQSFAKKCVAFGMKVFYYNRNRIGILDEMSCGASYVSFNTLISKCDIISINTPLTTETKGLISENVIDRMKDGVIFINTSRGGVVDENALIKNLKSGKIKCAGLDVFHNEPKVNSKLVKLKNVFLTPHIGSATEECRKKMELSCIENIKKVLAV